MNLRPSLSQSLIRQWMCQGNLDFQAHQFVLPLFITNRDDGGPVEIQSMPGVFRHSIESVIEFLAKLVRLDLKSVLLFPVMDKKGLQFSTDKSENPVLRAIPQIKKLWPDLYVIVDVCLCGFTQSGHCFIATSTGEKDDSLTLEKLSALSVAYASVGCDMIAPSDMNDGRVAAIRRSLNEHGFLNVPIMSYSAKFASNFYGPFRDAADSAPKHGDRRSYQLPPGSSALAIRAIERDIKEGADIVMVKPGMMYLDILSESRNRFPDIPRAVYHVSGEYSMLVAASESKTLDLLSGVLEVMSCFKRSGADIIITYFTPIILEHLKKID